MKLPHFAFFASDILKTITYKSTNKFISLLLREFPNTILGGGGVGVGLYLCTLTGADALPTSCPILIVLT